MQGLFTCGEVRHVIIEEATFSGNGPLSALTRRQRSFTRGKALRVSPDDHEPASRRKVGHQQGRRDERLCRGEGRPLPERRIRRRAVRATVPSRPIPGRPMPLDTLQGMPMMALPAFGGWIHPSICSGGIALLCCSRSLLPEQPSSKVGMPDQALQHVLQGAGSLTVWIRPLTGDCSGEGQSCEESRTLSR